MSDLLEHLSFGLPPTTHDKDTNEVTAASIVGQSTSSCEEEECAEALNASNIKATNEMHVNLPPVSDTSTDQHDIEELKSMIERLQEENCIRKEYVKATLSERPILFVEYFHPPE